MGDVRSAINAVDSLINLVGSGDFYEDYDESTAALWAARNALDMVNAALLEYEHVLQHVRDPHPVPGAPPQTACSECQRMAQAALDGTYRSHYVEAMSDGE